MHHRIIHSWLTKKRVLNVSSHSNMKICAQPFRNELRNRPPNWLDNRLATLLIGRGTRGKKVCSVKKLLQALSRRGQHACQVDTRMFQGHVLCPIPHTSQFVRNPLPRRRSHKGFKVDTRRHSRMEFVGEQIRPKERID